MERLVEELARFGHLHTTIATSRGEGVFSTSVQLTNNPGLAKVRGAAARFGFGLERVDTEGFHINITPRNRVFTILATLSDRPFDAPVFVVKGKRRLPPAARENITGFFKELGTTRRRHLQIVR